MRLTSGELLEVRSSSLVRPNWEGSGDQLPSNRPEILPAKLLTCCMPVHKEKLQLASSLVCKHRMIPLEKLMEYSAKL